MAIPSAASDMKSRSRLSREALIHTLRKGCKPRSQWRIGTEHEKLGFYADSLRRPSPETIEALLRDVGQQGDWELILEKDRVIGLRRGPASVTLEPGGQLELSGAPLRTVAETQAELEDHLEAVTRAGASLGVGFLGLGFDPLWTVADVPRMPKERYRIMREYMPTVGTLGHDMMFRSCTIQVNLDFESEEDMVTKFRVSLALQNIAGALFANSPFKDGADTGFASIRLHAWTDTDNARCGRLPWVFEPGMGFEKYVDYVLDVPLYFVFRDGAYHRPQAGVTFRHFMDGHPAAQSLRDAGLEATQEDWDLHLTTVFPDVRLKQFLEMRGADSGPLDMMLALPALWVGLLYDSDALARAAALVADWTPGELDDLRSGVPRMGLKLPFRGATVREAALQVLAIARSGLEARGAGEARYLDPLDAIAASGRTLADDLRERCQGEWRGAVPRVYALPGFASYPQGRASLATAEGAARGESLRALPGKSPRAEGGEAAPLPPLACALQGA